MQRKRIAMMKTYRKENEDVTIHIFTVRFCETERPTKEHKSNIKSFNIIVWNSCNISSNSNSNRKMNLHRLFHSFIFAFFTCRLAASFSTHSCKQLGSFTTCSKPFYAPSTRKNLVPAQGSQLVAASHAPPDQKPLTSENSEPVKKNLSAARSFIAKLFNAPSHQSAYENGFASIKSTEPASSDKETVLFFPIIGFQWVAVDDPVSPDKKKYMTVATTSNPACNIQSKRQTKDEEPYGWFTPCCHLDQETNSSP